MEHHAYQTLIDTYGERVEILARTIRARWRLLEIPLCDLVQTGIEGLLQAAENFDPTRGVAFWTFAEHRARGHILNSLEDLRRLPRRVLDRGNAVVDLQTASGQGQQDEVLFSQVFAQMTASFVLEIESNEPSPEDNAGYRSDTRELWDAVDKLPPRERFVVEQHHRMGIPFVEIAARMKIDKSGVSRLYKRAIGQLREVLAEDTDQESGEVGEQRARSARSKLDHATE